MSLTSAQNSKIKLVNRLRSKRGRLQNARFVIDYERDLQRALACGYRVDFVLHGPEIAGLSMPADVESHQVTPQLMAKISYRENPSGIIAVLESRPAQGLAEIRRAAINHVIVLDGLRVPGNIGALLRTADAADIDATILVDGALDLYNPNIIRSSTGACFRHNIFQLGRDETLAFLKGNRFRIVCADVDAETSIFQLDFGAKSAIVLGAEDCGLNRLWLDQADRRARIPMAGDISDSLNVSVSGAVMMYELFRQRHTS